MTPNKDETDEECFLDFDWQVECGQRMTSHPEIFIKYPTITDKLEKYRLTEVMICSNYEPSTER